MAQNKYIKTFLLDNINGLKLFIFPFLNASFNKRVQNQMSSLCLKKDNSDMVSKKSIHIIHSKTGPSQEKI